MVLAERGFDVYAVDSSPAMVGKTRGRVATVLGPSEAMKRVRLGRMEDLQDFDSEWFDLVIALGIYHSAASVRQWELALTETARVLAPGGRVLVASFSPASDPKGRGLRLVSGRRNVYEGFDSGPLLLLEADELDAGMSRHGLIPVVPTETAVTPTDSGRRVTVNGLYRKLER